MRSDDTEQPRALPDEIPDDPETTSDDVAVYLLPVTKDVDVRAAYEVIRELPGVTDVSFDQDDGTIMVWARREMLSEQELAAAMEHATPDLPEAIAGA
jgi:hypothetical protein